MSTPVPFVDLSIVVPAYNEEHRITPTLERLSAFLGWPFTAELARGRELIDRVRARCKLVLHGHRHIPRGVRLRSEWGDVDVYNAGSSTNLGGARVFEHADGLLVHQPWWLQAGIASNGATEWAAAPQAFASETAPAGLTT